ncbi:hypothetical protein F7D95_03195 [Prevotella copri]|uniref:Uncharacterized protein n=1 Tax=Segatella copri TaxID=165179 RepID=A0AA90UDQ6_9BACT|nr:hypothetical protein [Segatella copri]MQN11847.1 hypothetical protein [Segatella copri]
MTREEAKVLLPIIQAYAEGKEIEIFDKTTKMWKTAMLPHFDCDSKNYRIKPGVKYRPFANAEECLKEMQKHQPFGWIESGGYWYNIISTGVMGVKIIDTRGAVTTLYFGNLLRHYHFADGTPFGVKEEE